MVVMGKISSRFDAELSPDSGKTKDRRDLGMASLERDNWLEIPCLKSNSINMADELLQQAQELFEGQVVSLCGTFNMPPHLHNGRTSKAKRKPSSYLP